MLDLYVNIRNRRKELGMSQEELAKKVGYTSRSTIARIEKGEIDISRDKIFAFADALKTTPGDLMGLDGTLEKEYSKEISYHSQEFYPLVDILLSDPDLKSVIEKASIDTHYRQRLLGIAKLLENDK